MSDLTKQTIEVVKEIRFAVVMYGGVSLAIYINGVAQELLKMVRATAIDGDAFRFPTGSGKLDAVEELYRDLSYLLADKDLLNDKELLEEYRKWLGSRRTENNGKNPLREQLKRKTPKVVRFVVDILSGSSAGGINGIYLAKALASGQTINRLEHLWETEGDFAKLLRDGNSLKDDGSALGLPELTQPSLLNSERMYLKLLTAFGQMDDENNRENPESFVDEVDLFVTTTDYWGIPVPLRLSDRIIHERRHRQVFRFRYRKDDASVNDFNKKLYPFLAYSARCTSSFPLAFDPMQLTSANKVIKSVNDWRTPLKDCPEMPPSLWQRFFTPVTIENSSKLVSWDTRVFVDGGYLDNKPFGYAIEALAQKQSNVLVDRKLIYVEPEPDADDIIERATKTEPPGALTNTLSALTDMPRYETIREDLQQVLQRNRLIVRVNHLVSNARQDELLSFQLSADRLPEIIDQAEYLINKRAGRGWSDLTLAELAQQNGQSTNPYYRLRVAALTDALARMVTRRANFDPSSDYFFAVRDLVLYWREQNFGKEYGSSREVKTPMFFLSNYDYNYRLRRLRFVLQQADRLLKTDEDLTKELKMTVEIARKFKGEPPNDLKNGDADKRAFQKKALRESFPLLEPQIFDLEQLWEEIPSAIINQAFKDNKDDLERVVRDFKKEINQILNVFRRDMRRVEPDTGEIFTAEDTFVSQLVKRLDDEVKKAAVEIGAEGLDELLGKISDANDEFGGQFEADLDLKARLDRAEKVVKNRKIGDKLNEIGEILWQIYRGNSDESIFVKAIKSAETLFNSTNPDATKLQNAVRAYLGHFYQNFDAYDQILFPVTYETSIGEGVIVDVARISPIDATSLIDEQKEMRRQKESEHANNNPPYKAKRKVAGRVFRAFGAFFDKDWRTNDILWGRLDAAERLISIVLPNSIAPANRQAISELQKELIAEAHETILEKNDLIVARLKRSRHNRKFSGNRKYVQFMSDKDGFSVNRNLPETAVLATTGRSLAVLKKVSQMEDFGSLNWLPPIVLHGLNSAVNLIIPGSIGSVIIIYLALVGILVGAVWATFLLFFPQANWLPILALVGVVPLAFWIGLKNFLTKLIMRQITGKAS